MEALAAIVKAYDVRGLVGEQLTTSVAEAIGRAAAVELHGEAIVVGRDMRPSSPDLAEAFMEGVRAQGVDTVDIGLASTDLLYYASGRLGLPGAMWTASHNPAGYNGLKLCRAGAEPVSLDTGLAQIRDRALAGDYPHAEHAGSHRSADLLAEFAEHVRTFTDVEALRPLTVAVDAGNGMAGHVVPTVFEGLPYRLVPLYFELDGTFPNHPADPLVRDNLADLRRAVVEHGCDVGLAFDGDADRVVCVDERGQPVSPSHITAVIATTLLGRQPGATILYNLVCSRVVPEAIEAAGGEAVRTRVGHSYVKAVMKETDALFAGEHSGHYYFRDNFRADSGLIASVVLLEALCRHGGALSELVAPYDVYAASGELSAPVVDQERALETVAATFEDEADLEWLDGLTVCTPNWWFNLRPSNTEPLLRLNVEAHDEHTMGRVRDMVLVITGGGQAPP
jgi:phosphomannomutase